MPIDQSFFWTDSTCVLCYIKNQDKRFQTFVVNRIATIHEASSPSQWNYDNTKINPANNASRGVPADSLHRWIHCPVFLNHSSETWLQRPAGMTDNIPNNDPEVKVETATYATGTSVHDPVDEIMERFSSWSRFKKVVSWILRYKSNLQQLVKNRTARKSPQMKSSNIINPISVSYQS